MPVINHTDMVRGIRLRGSADHFAYQDDEGEMAFGPLCGRTLFFDPVADTEALSAHMSAAPGGHEVVEEVDFTRTLTRVA